MNVIDRLLSKTVTTALEKALDAASLRQQVTANNLANVNTPGFKRSTVHFEEFLQEALDTSGAIPSSAAGRSYDPASLVVPQVVREAGTSLRNDGNNVDMEAELALLNENTLWYNALTRSLGLQYSMLRQAITEGRR